MIEQLNNAVKFVCFYSASKLGVTGLTVTCDVYSPDGTLIVTAGAATAVGGGLYQYTLASGSVTTEGEYLAIFKTATTTVDAQHIPALWVVGRAGVENLDAAVSSRLATAGYTAPDNATITAIGAKTLNLPSDPADASDIAAAFGTVNTTLGTIGGYLDTEIAAIIASLVLVKAKTDLIGVASVSITSYYAVDGGTISLIGGDDYHAGESRRYEVTDTGNTWPDLTDAVVTLYAENDNYGVAFSKVMTVVTPSGAGKKLAMEFTAANTTTLRGQGGTEPGSTVVSSFTIRAALATTPTRTVTLVRGSISVTMVADGVNA